MGKKTNMFWQCNNCGARLPYNDGNIPAFCPSCGASFLGDNSQKQFPVIRNNMIDSPQQNQQPVYIQQPIVYREVVREESKKKNSGCLAWIILGLIILFIFVPAYNNYSEKKKLEESTTKQSTNRSDYQTVEYEDLSRNPDKYEGDLVKFTGAVLQVMESSRRTQIRLATKKMEYFDMYTDDVIFCEFMPSIIEGRILEGDIITVYGECNGLKKYTAVLGNEVTIPSIMVSIIDFQEK